MASQLTPTQAKQALAALEACLSEVGDKLKQEAPTQHARAERLVKVLKSGKAGAAEAGALAIELMRWQLGLQKRHYQAQLAAIAPLVAQRQPAAVEAKAALEGLIGLLDSAVAATQGPAGPSPKVVAVFRQSALDTQAAVKRANEAMRRSVMVPLTRLTKQPAIKLVKPGAPAPQPLTSFKVRPGVTPLAAGKPGKSTLRK